MFMERMLSRRSSQGEADTKKPEGLERSTSQDENQNQPQLRRQRRNSRLQRFKDMLHSEEELDEAGKVYAKLM
jgi:hypothetical protein